MASHMLTTNHRSLIGPGDCSGTSPKGPDSETPFLSGHISYDVPADENSEPPKVRSRMILAGQAHSNLAA